MAVAVTPADQASGIERDAVISVTFSADMRPETLDPSTFLVARGGAAVNGSVTYDAGTHTATFHPATLLALLGDYTATITQGATDTGGMPLSEERTWSFEVRDGRWSAAELIVPDSLWDSWPRAASDPMGRANLVWDQGDSGLRWARFEATSGWQAPESLDPVGWEVAIASDPAGNMIAAWLRRRDWSVPTSLVGSRFVPGSGWGPITLLEEDDAYGHDVGYLHDVASDPDGNFIVVWDQVGDDDLTHVWARRFVPASGWAPAALLGQGVNPRVAIDASGHATASWMQPNGTDYGHDIAASHFDPAAGWSAPRTLDSDSGAGRACCVRLAAAAAGDVTSVWMQYDTSTSPARRQTWTARWSNGDWSAATQLDTGGGNVLWYPELAGDPAGNETVLWSEGGDGEIAAKSRRYLPATGWGPATVIQTGALSQAIDVDPAGNGIGLWTESDGTTGNLWAGRLTADTGWSPAVRIDADEAGDTFFPVIAVDDLGGAVVAWVRTIGPSGRKVRLWRATFE